MAGGAPQSELRKACSHVALITSTGTTEPTRPGRRPKTWSGFRGSFRKSAAGLVGPATRTSCTVPRPWLRPGSKPLPAGPPARTGCAPRPPSRAPAASTRRAPVLTDVLEDVGHVVSDAPESRHPSPKCASSPRPGKPTITSWRSHRRWAPERLHESKVGVARYGRLIARKRSVAADWTAKMDVAELRYPPECVRRGPA